MLLLPLLPSDDLSLESVSLGRVFSMAGPVTIGDEDVRAPTGTDMTAVRSSLSPDVLCEGLAPKRYPAVGERKWTKPALQTVLDIE